MTMRLKMLFLWTVCVSLACAASGQLKPGFDATEYLTLLQIAAHQSQGLFPQADSLQAGMSKRGISPIPSPRQYTLVYRSAEVGLFNQWDLWLKKDSSVAVISVRGTISNTASWLENFYAAMLPATGSLKLNDSTTFSYHLAANPRAAVHAGWLLGLAFLAPSIVREVRSYAAAGVSQFIVFGHSQGGAIAFLLTSYLRSLPDSVLPAGLIFKTYASAAPKPGNLYYAYDFDALTRGGWALRVVNEKDWVPETPFSLQTLDDFNHPNPFTRIKPALKRTSLLVRLYAGHLFGRLDRSSKKANRRFRKTLGRTVYRQIRHQLPEFPEPAYAPTLNYMTAGVPIILAPYPGYDKDFPDDGKNDFLHHGLQPYYQLVLHETAPAGR